MKKQHVKYCLDIIMTICFICIMKIRITGMGLHERLGLIILGLVILHIALNYRWVKGVALRLFDKKLNIVTKISVVLNIALAALSILLIVSGVLVSVTMFRNIAAENRELWAVIHRKAGLLLFVCISVHVGLHWKMIMFGFRNMFKIKESNLIRTYSLRTISAIIMLLGLLALGNNSILKANKETYNHKKSTKVQAIIEYSSIMGLFIGGTYYTLKIGSEKSKKKIN